MTCECHEIKEIVDAAIKQAIVGLESNLTLKINKAVTGINVTDSTVLSLLEQNVNLTMTKLDNMEDSLKDTIKQVIHPIQLQLDYHLPQPQPAESCKEIYKSHPHANSGYYIVNTTSGLTKVYCKMDSNCAYMTGGCMTRESSDKIAKSFIVFCKDKNYKVVSFICKSDALL